MTMTARLPWSSAIIVKFAHNAAALALITYNNEQVYLEEVKKLLLWCEDNKLLSSVN